MRLARHALLRSRKSAHRTQRLCLCRLLRSCRSPRVARRTDFAGRRYLLRVPPPAARHVAPRIATDRDQRFCRLRVVGGDACPQQRTDVDRRIGFRRMHKSCPHRVAQRTTADRRRCLPWLHVARRRPRAARLADCPRRRRLRRNPASARCDGPARCRPQTASGLRSQGLQTHL